MAAENSGSSNLESIALFGGSFNPVHNGHLRLAVEMWEALRPERLDFIPSANPPHKPGAGMLPFALRVELLRAACAAFPQFFVNTLEAERNEPSYTAVTLARYRELYPKAELYFVMGSEDFKGLNAWKDWQVLPRLANLLIVPRQGLEEKEFTAAAKRLWPGATPCRAKTLAGQKSGATGGQADEKPLDFPVAFRVDQAAGAGRLLYLPLPRLDINASMLRRHWLAGRSLSFWTPDSVLEILARNADLAAAHWG